MMLNMTNCLSLLVLLGAPLIRSQSAPAVAIVSGYAGVSRFGRNLDARRFNNVRAKVSRDERAPFFDLERMEEDEMLQRKIDEVRRQVMEEEKRQKEALRRMRLNHQTLKMESAQGKHEEIPWSDKMRMSEPRVQRMMQLRHIRHHGKLETLDNNEPKLELDNDDVRQPPETIDLGSVQEVL